METTIQKNSQQKTSPPPTRVEPVPNKLWTWWVDTESVQFIGATCLIQYQYRDESGNLSEIILHNPIYERAGVTCELIENMMKGRFVGFNLSHDMHHLTRVYNVCKMYSYMEIPIDDLETWMAFERTEEARKYCLLPAKAVDLMLIGQRNKFQSLIKQKPIKLKKVAKVLAKPLVDKLDEVLNLNPLLFAGDKQGKKWRIKPIYGPNAGKELAGNEIGNDKPKPNLIDKNFVNLELPFAPKKTLKAIMKHLFNKEIKEFDPQCKKYKERFWFPTSGDYIIVFHDWMNMWRNDPNQRIYAKNDIVYTKLLDEYFGEPDEDYSSLLACMLGNQYWKGYAIDMKIAGRELKKAMDVVSKTRNTVQVNSAAKCKEYLAEGENIIITESIMESKTDVDTLERYTKGALQGLAKKAQLILDGRHAEKRVTMCMRVIEAGKMYCQFKVGGTATNRMAGGNLEGRGESINPQGIPSEKTFREMFTFVNDSRWCISGGDAKSFEVCIAASIFGDEQLTKDLQNDLSFHGLFGAAVYDMDYNKLLATGDLEGQKNLYKRAKSAVFAWFYGGSNWVLAETLGLEVEEVDDGIARLEEKYPGIKIAREKIWDMFMALRQPVEGGQVNWHEPEKKIETFLGFERSFETEFEVIKAIYDLANNLPPEFKELTKHLPKVTRKEEKGPQSIYGSLMSCLFAGAFQLQSKVMKVASNFVIQSPGAEMIKMLQVRIINKFQPRGIHEYRIVSFNIHDELIFAHLMGLEDDIEKEVQDFVQEYKKYVPLFRMGWKKNKRNWAETH